MPKKTQIITKIVIKQPMPKMAPGEKILNNRCLEYTVSN